MPRCKLCKGLYAGGILYRQVCFWCRQEAQLRKIKKREKRRRAAAKSQGL